MHHSPGEPAPFQRSCCTTGPVRLHHPGRRIHIDLFHDLDSYEVDAPQGRGKSAWRKRVEADIRFDPYQEFISFMALDVGTEAPHWELTPGEKLAQKAHGDDLPLRDQKVRRGKDAETQPESIQQRGSDKEAVQTLSAIFRNPSGDHEE